MKIKEKISNLPVWKMAVYVLLFMFIIGFAMEELFIHSVFKIIDRAFIAMEKDKKADLADLNDMDKHEQEEYCQKYHQLQREKSDLAKKGKADFNYDFDSNTIKGHEIEINTAAANHLFNPMLCDKRKS